MENDAYTARLMVLEHTARELEMDLTAMATIPEGMREEVEIVKNIHELVDGPFTVVLKRRGKIVKVEGNYSEEESSAIFMQKPNDEIVGYIQ